MSLNDPQWGNRGNDDNDGGGRRPNQGPPDLDQLWRDLNRRLSGMFDKKRGGGDRGGDGGDRPPVQFSPKFLGGGIGLLLVLVLIVWLGSGFYIVDAGQRGLVLQFGRYKEISEPGLSVAPWIPSQSASPASASPASSRASSTSVTFSAPTTATRSYAPLATAR